MTAPTRMPVVYLGHGAPPLADDALWTSQLAEWSRDLPRPKAILVVSAHWEAAPVTLGATRTVPLTYDFWGFPQRYYEVQYAAPGAPQLASEVARLLGDVAHDEQRGLDHGAYVPLVEMYPDADIPVLQLSMPTLAPAELFEMGRRLAPLREQGVLVMGSGFVTHNLRLIEFGHGGAADQRHGWSVDFDEWTTDAMRRGDVDALLDFMHKAPAAQLAHPRTEHFAPIFVSMGAAYGADGAAFQARSVIDGYWYGLAKRSFQIA
ncbi:dioxygenase [Blastococcus sp. Marseille-P5729]|uniref:dioxygenase family protein n=1 Tax=Blastococcus sp. Marseille-P5729 TaxID=2086582 RepID=UPI000D1026A8|nr:class III extradiol ring-cleavage dioxygenase [Blastococcus sp. Marseille-P5729]